MPRLLLLSLLLLSAASQGAPSERTYTAKNRTIRYSVTIFDPPIPAKPAGARLNQETALNCAALFRSRLGAGDLEGAAQLTTDPARFLATYQKYRERVGEAVYRQQLAKLASEDLRYRYELAIGAVHALVADDERGVAHYVRVRDGKFFVEYPDTQKLPKEIDDLSALVNDIADGKLKIER